MRPAWRMCSISERALSSITPSMMPQLDLDTLASDVTAHWPMLGFSGVQVSGQSVVSTHHEREIAVRSVSRSMSTSGTG